MASDDFLVEQFRIVGSRAAQPGWCEFALVQEGICRPDLPLPASVSPDPSRRRHAECRHPVEHAAPDFRLGPLIGQSPGVKAPADDGLVAKHRGLDQASSIVA